MENISKALLMAGGVLLGVLLLMLVVLSYNNISEYYKQKINITEEEQIAQFNNEYEQYNRQDVKGSDLLTLVNKVVDYNERKADEKEEINLTIIINKSDSNYSKFYYKKDKLNTVGAVDIIGTITGEDKEVDINGPDILSGYINNIITNSGLINENKLQLLTKNISNLYDYDDEKTEYKKAKRDDIIKEIYGKDDSYTVTESDIKRAKKAAQEYYQIQQFKRAHFKCIEVEYYNSGKIKSLSFEFANKFN